MTETNAGTETKNSAFKEFMRFVWENKIWWITPTILILVFLAAIVLMTQGTSIAPFFYALF